jgi:hypothetical protein
MDGVIVKPIDALDRGVSALRGCLHGDPAVAPRGQAQRCQHQTKEPTRAGQAAASGVHAVGAPE